MAPAPGLRVLITGGAGFIGSALARHLIANSSHAVHVLDKLTYAGNLASLAPIASSPRYGFTRADICDAPAVASLFASFDPDIVVHLAAETHVDRSIDGPGAFISTNVVGTYVLLEAAMRHYERLNAERRSVFKFHHVSTDEVFGSLGDDGFFTEETSYDPRSPYSASKAGSDHLVRAWWHTYKLPITVTNCSNNYGPYQYPEKLIPVMIIKALAGEPLPIYGKGQNVRDWLFVDDHARAIELVFETAQPGATYNVGGRAERKNIDVVTTICAALDKLRPRNSGSYTDLMSYVPDRPGHDFRYAIDCQKIENQLGWKSLETFTSGLEHTVRWYLDREDWWRPLLDKSRTPERLGLGDKR